VVNHGRQLQAALVQADLVAVSLPGQHRAIHITREQYRSAQCSTHQYRSLHTRDMSATQMLAVPRQPVCHRKGAAAAAAVLVSCREAIMLRG
jgi:hypothetical protein